MTYVSGVGVHEGGKKDSATLFVRNLDLQASDGLLWELFMRCGPLERAQVHRNPVTRSSLGEGSVEFKVSDDADYALRIMNGIKLFGKTIYISKSIATGAMGAHQGFIDPNAITTPHLVKLFVGNLAPEITQVDLRKIFEQFGLVLDLNIPFNEELNQPANYAFVVFETFEQGDRAIAALHRQYVGQTQINVEYALRNSESGERYGTQADRELVQRAVQSQIVIGSQADLNMLAKIGASNLGVTQHDELAGGQQQDYGARGQQRYSHRDNYDRNSRDSRDNGGRWNNNNNSNRGSRDQQRGSQVDYSLPSGSQSTQQQTQYSQGVGQAVQYGDHLQQQAYAGDMGAQQQQAFQQMAALQAQYGAYLASNPNAMAQYQQMLQTQHGITGMTQEQLYAMYMSQIIQQQMQWQQYPPQQ